MSKQIPAAVREYLSSLGKKGGKASGACKARPSEVARAAINLRWDRYRAKQAAEGAKKGH